MDIPSYLMGKSAGSKNARTVVVNELPETGEPNIIYLVPKQTTGDNDIFDEYIWVENDWELIGSTTIDISGKQDIMQFSTMPTADSTTVGKIIQYTGTTNANYTNGYFYIGINDNGSYGWSNINVQPASDTGSNYLGKTSLYNTQNTALDLNTLKTGVYILKQNSSNNKMWLKATYKLSANAEPTTQTLELDLYQDLTNARVVLNELLLYIDTEITEDTVGTSTGVQLGSLTISLSDGTKPLVTNYKTFKAKSTGLEMTGETFEHIPTVLVQSGLQPYSTTTTYQIGDYVYRSVNVSSGTTTNKVNKVYKCKTANTTGTWSSSKWDEKTYMDYLSDTLVGGALNGSY